MSKRVEVCQYVERHEVGVRDGKFSVNPVPCGIPEEHHDDHLSGHPYVAPSATTAELLVWTAIAISIIGALVILASALGWLTL